MTDDPQICPFCRGKRRSTVRDSETKPQHWCIDPEYIVLRPGMNWAKDFWVCKACLGSGKLQDSVSRILSGEFDPALSKDTI